MIIRCLAKSGRVLIGAPKGAADERERKRVGVLMQILNMQYVSDLGRHGGAM